MVHQEELIPEASIQEQALDRFIEEAYKRYAILTILDRALPDVRDGLKPVQRRILYAMFDLGLVFSSPHKKSARVVGEVLGKYHPHGDTSVYDAMVRMAQDFSMRMPLVDGQGNFGSIDGDGAAAMRYTEARLSALGQSMLDDLDKDTVNWRPNFDGSLKEPAVLPARFPNLLVNGASGIAVGMSTNMLPHNLAEVCDAVIFMAKNWKKRDKITVAELMKFIPGPDLPTGGLLYRYRVNGDEKKVDMITRAYELGTATMVCQAKADIQDIGGGKSEIIVTELPYQVQKTTILERIASNRDKFAGITDVRDESDYKGMRVVFEVARSADPNEVLERLLTHTQMRASLSYNALALVTDAEGKAAPRQLTLPDLLREFIAHRLVVITRRSKFELAKAEARMHILDGLLKALSMIDEVIDIIRHSQTVETAKVNLIKKLTLSDIQAQAILDMPLRRLASLERKKLEDERKDLAARVKDFKDILAREERRLDIVAEETIDIKNRFGDPRRTIIVDAEEGHQARITVSDLVTPTEPQLVLVNQSTVQRVNAKDFRESVTAGKPTVRAVEFPLLRLRVDVDEQLVLLSSAGRMWHASPGRLPLQSSNADLGLKPGETIIGCGIPKKDQKLVLVTRSGSVKRIAAEDLPNGRTEGSWTPVIGLDGKGDAVIVAGFATDKASVLICTSGSKESPARALRFETGAVNTQVAPSAKGVAAIKMLGDSLIGGALIEPAVGKSFVILLSQQGHVKRISLEEFPIQGRAGQGVQIWKTNETTGLLTACCVAKESDNLDFYSEKGKRLRLKAKELPQVTRAIKGTNLPAHLKLTDGLFSGDPPDGVTVG